MSRASTNPHSGEDIAHHSLASNPVEFDGIRKQFGRTRLNQIVIQQMKLLTADELKPQLPEGKKGK